MHLLKYVQMYTIMSTLTAELFYSPAKVPLLTYFFECYDCYDVFTLPMSKNSLPMYLQVLQIIYCI